MTKARDLANAADVLDDVSATELSYVNGVTSAIQTQLNAKQAVVSGVDDTEIGYLNGVTSAIQTQIDSKIGQATAINPTIVDAKGDIIAATAADTVARLAVGSNDQVLTADSSTATGLKWAAASSGGMTLLETLTLSGSSVVSSTIPGSYVHLQLVIRNFRPVNNGAHLHCRINGDTSSNYINQNLMGQSYNVAFSETQWIFAFGQNNTANTYSTGYVPIYDYANTATWKSCYPQLAGNGDTTAANVTSNMYKNYYNQTGAITSLTFYAETGNMTSGSVLIYGVK